MSDVKNSFPERINLVQSSFICPECHSEEFGYESESHQFKCQSCASVFETQNWAPILLSRASKEMLGYDTSLETGQAMIQEYESLRSKSSHSSWKSRIISWITPPSLMLHYNPKLTEPVTQKLFNHQGDKTKILNVGGGPIRYSDHEITMNLEEFHNVDLVSDAHNIPFKDDSFDTVFSIAVLEHVPEPNKVIEEMIRTLKPGGYMYAEVPFIYFFHGYPNDYQRYTQEGIRYLFRDLKDVEIGITEGSVSSVLQSTNMVLNLFLPDRFPLFKKAFNGVFRWLFFPLKYLDLLIKNKKDAHILAGGFYIIGKK
jgi:SAM-dependent methyltransferase